MKEKLTSFFVPKINFLKKKWKLAILIVVLLLIVISKIIPDGFNPKTEIVEDVKLQNLQKTVKATGVVTSIVDLELSFNNPGRVSTVNVKLGQRVSQGQVLASLSAGAELGQLNQAYGALKSAQAALQKTIEGATTEEVRVAEVALDSAKRALATTKRLQDTLVKNARATLYSSSLVAVSTYSNSTNTAPTISGTYTGDTEDEYTINIYPTGAGNYASFTSTSGDSGSVPVSTSGPLPMGTKGLYVTFTTSYTAESYKVKIPNTASVNYVTNLNALKSAEENRQSAIDSAQGAVDAAEANLALKKAAARPSDIEAREADVLTAQGRVQSAQGAYEEKIIRAPIGGVITKLDVNVGENVDSKKVVIALQDNGELYLEANVNEGDIDEIKQGQIVTFTVDTIGTTENFKGEVSYIDQSPTKDGNIVNYKIKAKILEGKEKIKTGATANMSILIQEKDGIVTIPNRSVYKRDDGSNYVLLVTNEKAGKTKEVPVTIGFTGDGAVSEVLTGLIGGEKVLFKTK